MAWAFRAIGYSFRLFRQRGAIVDSKDDRPLYVQVYSDMLGRIQKKEWAKGFRLPTELNLCESYGVSRITIRLAMQQLVDKGYIVRKQGKGTFVSEPHVEQRLDTFYSFGENGENAKSKVLKLAVVRANKRIADNLEVEEEQEVYQLERIRYFGDTPFAYENSYLPYVYGRKLSSAIIEELGLYKSLETLYGIIPQCAIETFEAVNIRKKEAGYLQISDNQAVMKIDRIAKSGEEVIEYCISIVRGDKIKYRSELR